MCDEVSEYLKDGESVLDCIKRNRKDLVNTLGDFADERKKRESLEAEVERLREALKAIGCDLDMLQMHRDRVAGNVKSALSREGAKTYTGDTLFGISRVGMQGSEND